MTGTATNDEDVLRLSPDELTERIADCEARLKLLRRALKLAKEYEDLRLTAEK